MSASVIVSMVGIGLTFLMALMHIASMFSRVATKLESIEKTVGEIKDSLTKVDEDVRDTQHRIVALETRIAVPGALNGIGH